MVFKSLIFLIIKRKISTKVLRRRNGKFYVICMNTHQEFSFTKITILNIFSIRRTGVTLKLIVETDDTIQYYYYDDEEELYDAKV